MGSFGNEDVQVSLDQSGDENIEDIDSGKGKKKRALKRLEVIPYKKIPSWMACLHSGWIPKHEQIFTPFLLKGEALLEMCLQGKMFS
ncbi:hypothetical protein JCGZ_00468 [Jatropha curcas]|uniref:Uncharacterized protein n=1 Tax=Jatropha curcas TaxID=180498 RepID=A0A067LFB5_JATCU|nr:hypothetical protein JCGZ_00468 [Jatropha curcas]